MKISFFISLLLLLLAPFTAPAQTEADSTSVQVTVRDSTLLKPYTIDPLAPSKAAFRSAILPGLGQAYNKKYWKIPIVYGGMGLSMYYYSFNNKKYKEYRNAYKNRLAGKPIEGRLSELDQDRLIAGQRFHQRNRDLSLLLTVGIYILNIVDANVDAHLMQFNVNENLSVRPDLQQNDLTNKHNMGLCLSYQF